VLLLLLLTLLLRLAADLVSEQPLNDLLLLDQEGAHNALAHAGSAAGPSVSSGNSLLAPLEVLVLLGAQAFDL
jgi:hypothetical protein